MEDEELQSLVDKAKELQVWHETYGSILDNPSVLKVVLRNVIASKKLIEACMRETYMKGGKFSLPPITPNKDVSPSINGNSRSVTIVTEDGIEKKVKLRIPTAKIKDLKTKVWMDPGKVKIPFESKDKHLESSVLGANYSAKGFKFSYANEFDVQNLALAIVQDVICALGLPQEVLAHLEITLYTLRPDMVVVLRHEGRMIFVIEVKSPGKENEVFSSENTGGQIWSYLHAMKQLGNDLPMGAIMTYNKIALVTLEDCGTNEAHKELLQHTSEVLSTGIIPERKAPANKIDCKAPRVSPIRHHKKISDTVLTQKAASEFDENIVIRDIFYSKVYKDGEVFPSLLQALEMAYHRCKDIHILKDLPGVHAGDNLGQRLFFKVVEDGYSWVVTPQKYKKQNTAYEFCANVGELPTKDSKHFYMLGKAGEGSEGAVYIACDKGARLCAIKIYYINPSPAATAEKRDLDEAQASKECWKKAEKECEHWTQIYKERFKNVRRLYLGGRPCLLLPYGLEIDTHEKRKALLPDIQHELLMIAKNHRLRYKDSDLRWRHLLLDSNGKVFLSDLGSLEIIPSEAEGVGSIEHVVKEQMEALKNSISISESGLPQSPGSSGTKRKFDDTVKGEL
jgi:hypothetical protein